MTNTQFKILLVDDEEDILEILGYNLSNEGYVISKCSSGVEALERYQEIDPDLIILDIMMPEIDGIEVCKQIRAEGNQPHLLIAFLTARSESFTQIVALDAGGDDFITKPIKPSVFKSKVKSILRRHPKSYQNEQATKLTFGLLEINLTNYTISIDGNEISLPKKEFDLLVLLSSNTGRVFKRQEILNKVWGREVLVGDRTIDVHIRKLREKIGSAYIQTMKGVGYKFVID